MFSRRQLAASSKAPRLRRPWIRARRPWVRGFLAREFCRRPSNQRSTLDLGDYLTQHEIVGLHGFDTRALTRHLRERGAVDGIIGTDGSSVDALKEELSTYGGLAGLDLTIA